MNLEGSDQNFSLAYLILFEKESNAFAHSCGHVTAALYHAVKIDAGVFYTDPIITSMADIFKNLLKKISQEWHYLSLDLENCGNHSKNLSLYLWEDTTNH